MRILSNLLYAMGTILLAYGAVHSTTPGLMGLGLGLILGAIYNEVRAKPPTG